MKTTKDYSIFKKHKSNRNLNEKNVCDIMKSMIEVNLIHLDPIIVDESMQVIDGQHRLEAATRLGLEVCYVISQQATSKNIQLLNCNQMKWVNIDYLNFFANEGYKDYISLRNFMERQGLPLAVALSVLVSSGGQQSRDFKTGKFKFPSPLEAAESLEVLNNFRVFGDYMRAKTLDEKSYLTSATLMKAFVNFFNVKTIEFAKFMTSLPYRLDVMRPSGRVREYMLMLKDIYNYRNKRPLSDMDIGL